MISVTAAKQIINEHYLQTPVATLPLQDAFLLQLASAIYSPVNVPAFTQSSMDGYAFAYADLQPKKKLLLRGQMQAGSKTVIELHPGEAARIFTGAPLPMGADTVVMQERTTVINHELIIEDDKLFAGANARPAGAAIAAGAVALEKGSRLNAASIGFLAGMGISEIPVYCRPAVGIIVTGDELQQPGRELAPGQVYESNAFALGAALQQAGVAERRLYRAADEPEEVKRVIATAIAENDMVLITGGVSVGDYDFVVAAATACGVQQLFHKIKQKPGKPLYFGKKENKLVFGLPGNPSSVLTCFYEYVLLALQLSLPVLRAPLEKSITKPAGLTHFLKAWFNGSVVTPLDAQESYRMSSFAKANCLISVNEETTSCEAGELAEIHLLYF